MMPAGNTAVSSHTEDHGASSSGSSLLKDPIPGVSRDQGLDIDVQLSRFSINDCDSIPQRLGGVPELEDEGSEYHTPDTGSDSDVDADHYQHQTRVIQSPGKGKGKEKSPGFPGGGNGSDEKGLGEEAIKGEYQLYYRGFRNEEEDLPGIMSLIEAELSEPYNVYTFRYFLLDWPHLTFLVYPSPDPCPPIAVIVCKQDYNPGKTSRGYIAMLSVDKAWRRRGIATNLVQLIIHELTMRGAHEVVLETEFDNETSLALYHHLGFYTEARLESFYSNGKDAFRLILPLTENDPPPEETPEELEEGRWRVSEGPEDWDQWAKEWDALYGPPPSVSPDAEKSDEHEDERCLEGRADEGSGSVGGNENGIREASINGDNGSGVDHTGRAVEEQDNLKFDSPSTSTLKESILNINSLLPSQPQPARRLPPLPPPIPNRQPSWDLYT